jgi:hypothetical protein
MNTYKKKKVHIKCIFQGDNHSREVCLINVHPADGQALKRFHARSGINAALARCCGGKGAAREEPTRKREEPLSPKARN